MTTEYEIIDLFPTAVLKKELGRPLNQEEFAFLNLDRPVSQNIGNFSSEDSSILDHPEMQQIKMFCLYGLCDYMENITCPGTIVSPYITQSWLNWTKQGQRHHEHQHPNSFLSGVFYLNADPSDEITFHSNRLPTSFILHPDPDDNNKYNSTAWSLPAISGVLYIFPSWLRHSVETKEAEGARISLAFNSFLRGEIGRREGKSQLIL